MYALQFIYDIVSFQVANKLLEFLLKLRELGYPSHLTDVAKNGLKCNVHADQADRMVSESPKVMLMQSSNNFKLFDVLVLMIRVRFLLYHTSVRQRYLSLSG